MKTRPRYQGARGAIASGLTLLGIMTGIGALGGGAIWLLTGDSPVALQVTTRVILFGVVLGGAVVLCRWLCGGASDRLFSMRITRGDIASYAAFLGILLAGYLDAGHLPATSGAEQSLRIGKVLKISGPTLDGGHFDLADHRGKVVLVDFWATWCGPCVAELPHIREAYDQYHDHGLDVVSVSLDFERSALVNFLKTKPLPWPQIFFDGPDTRGAQNPLARRYGIQAIPCLLVTDREGRLVAQDVRGKQISATIAETLGESISATDRPAGGGLHVVGWFLHGFLAAPVWLVLVCGWGASALAGLVEAALRRSFTNAERVV